jgi:hypothetical protein
MTDLHSLQQLIAQTPTNHPQFFTFTIIGSMPLSFGNLLMNFLRSYSTYSKTSTSLRLECTTSNNLTMLGWFSYFRIEISRMAVLGMPSYSLSSRIFLRAYIWSVYLSGIGSGRYRGLCRRHRRCPSRACRLSRISRVCCAASYYQLYLNDGVKVHAGWPK